MAKAKPPITAGKMHDPSFCHYCNVNKLDPKDKYFRPNAVEVCQAATSEASMKKYLVTQP